MISLIGMEMHASVRHAIRTQRNKEEGQKVIKVEKDKERKEKKKVVRWISRHREEREGKKEDGLQFPPAKTSN